MSVDEHDGSVPAVGVADVVITPPQLPPLTGDERFEGITGTVKDFWSFALPDLRVNNVRGWFAEYLVARALGITAPRRREWDLYDVEWQGITIEVKASGYMQAFTQPRPSELKFGGLAARAQPLDSLVMADERTYNADVYVFAVQIAPTHADYDPLDVGQWRFAVLPSETLVRLGYRSITWKRAVAEAGGDLGFAELREAIRGVGGAASD